MQKGFTLIELAIALMVIGLLIGGVLKGQELIQNARITALIKQVNDTDTAVMIFRSTYGAIPGDIRNPGSRIPNCTAALCSDTGDGNGLITLSIEHRNFFPHLTKAGMLRGPEGGAVAPTTSEEQLLFFPLIPADGEVLTVMNETILTGAGVTIINANIYRFGKYTNWYSTPKFLGPYDQKVDDGNPASWTHTT